MCIVPLLIRFICKYNALMIIESSCQRYRVHRLRTLTIAALVRSSSGCLSAVGSRNHAFRYDGRQCVSLQLNVLVSRNERCITRVNTVRIRIQLYHFVTIIRFYQLYLISKFMLLLRGIGKKFFFFLFLLHLYPIQLMLNSHAHVGCLSVLQCSDVTIFLCRTANVLTYVRE